LWDIDIIVHPRGFRDKNGHQNTYIARPGIRKSETIETASIRWTPLLWLIPVISLVDMLWAVGAKMGTVVTFGLGLYKMELIHVIVQLSLIIALSVFYVASGSPAEVCEVQAEAVEPSEDENSA